MLRIGSRVDFPARTRYGRLVNDLYGIAQLPKEVSMKRVATSAALLAVLVLLSAGVAGGAPDSRHGPTKLTVWVGWSAGNELTSFKKLAAEYQSQHTDLTLSLVATIPDSQIAPALHPTPPP